ncbi:hypothetical protein ACFTAO_13830 [Paenibacillus rhizoplanae]
MGCSTIAPFSIINPVRELDQFVTYGVASRDLDRSTAYALKHQIPHVFLKATISCWRRRTLMWSIFRYPISCIRNGR